MKIEIQKAYDEILKVLRTYKDICTYNVDEFEKKAKLHLFGLELKEKYELNINPKEVISLDYQSFGDKKIGLFGAKYHRTISWPVDGRQPEDEYLFTVSFPTGAYIFGHGESNFNKDYPTEFFQKFWLELKSYKPDYLDEVNHVIYWKLENAKDIFNNYESILSKYHDLNKEDIKQRKIAKMKADLEKLEKSS